jgi:hypothetical protein
MALACMSGKFIWMSVLWFGGHEVIRHVVLLLSERQLLPLCLVPFLERARFLKLLRRVGGSYLFIHRSFQDHLASEHG